MVDATWDQISSTGHQPDGNKRPHDFLTASMTAREPGYAYIFVSNEDPKYVEVYFDDVTVTHVHSPIVVGSDYYPFGLQQDGMVIDDKAYRYGFQGQFSEKNEQTGLQDFALRQYDPRIGRWLSPDPYGQFSSAYIGLGNQPNSNIDPNGGLTFNFGRGLAVGTFSGILAATIDAQANGRDGMRGFVIGFAGGFIAGGVNWRSITLPKFQKVNLGTPPVNLIASASRYVSTADPGDGLTPGFYFGEKVDPNSFEITQIGGIGDSYNGAGYNTSVSYLEQISYGEYTLGPPTAPVRMKYYSVVLYIPTISIRVHNFHSTESVRRYFASAFDEGRLSVYKRIKSVNGNTARANDVFFRAMKKRILAKYPAAEVVRYQFPGVGTTPIKFKWGLFNLN